MKLNVADTKVLCKKDIHIIKQHKRKGRERYKCSELLNDGDSLKKRLKCWDIHIIKMYESIIHNIIVVEVTYEDFGVRINFSSIFRSHNS